MIALGRHVGIVPSGSLELRSGDRQPLKVTLCLAAWRQSRRTWAESNDEVRNERKPPDSGVRPPLALSLAITGWLVPILLASAPEIPSRVRSARI